MLPSRQDLSEQLNLLLGLQEPRIECSGTAALIVALTVILRNRPKNERQRDTVIIPAYTCPLVALAIAHCDLRVKLCDLKAQHFDLDHEQLPGHLDSRTLAVIPTHLGGRVAEVASLEALAANHGAVIIEDAAQALGAEVGRHGAFSFYSLAAGKGLSLYEGGVLVAKTAELHREMQQTSRQLIPSRKWMELRRCAEFAAYTAFYRPHGLYYAYGLARRRALAAGDLLRAVGDDVGGDIPLHRVSRWRKNAGANAIRRLPDFLVETRMQAERRVERLRQINGLVVFSDSETQKGVWPFLMVLMPDAVSCSAALDLLWHRPLGVSRLFIHALSDYAFLGNIVPSSEVPNARDFASRLLTLSNSLWLNDTEFEEICRRLESAVQ